MKQPRHFARLDSRLCVAYRVLSTAHAQRTRTRDIGGGGICLALSKPLDRGTCLEVTVALPHHERPLRFTAEVMWCQPHEPKGLPAAQGHQELLAGVRVVDIDPEAREVLRSYGHQ